MSVAIALMCSTMFQTKELFNVFLFALLGFIWKYSLAIDVTLPAQLATIQQIIALLV